MIRRIQQLSWIMATLLLSVALVHAQAAVCDTILGDALQALEDNCDGTGRNQACYGYDQVEAGFVDDVSVTTFARPADTAEVADLATLRTAPLDETAGTWGVALMTLQANLPNTLPGQNVTMILMGDTEVENAVAPDDAFDPSDGIEVTILSAAGANIRSGAGLNFNVIGGAATNERFMADGLSEDGDWLRIAYRNRPAWISRTVIDDRIAGLDTLPRLGSDLYTPMQAFYLRTGIGQPACNDLPDSSLLVQGPEEIEINITVNGADIQLGSTGLLRVIEIDGAPFLEIIVLDGTFTTGGQTIRAGQRSVLCLGSDDNRGLDGKANDLIVTCDPSEPEDIDPDIFGERFCRLEGIPSNLLSYPIEVLCPGETAPPRDTTRIDTNSSSATNSAIQTVNCENFGLISPLTPTNSGNQTFSWRAASGDNIRYQLVFYNYQGNEVESFWTSETQYGLNLGAQTSTGGQFSWEVRAYQNGEYACVTTRSQTLVRTGELNPVVVDEPTSEFTAFISNCGVIPSVDYVADITWQNAEDGVVISWEDTSGMPNSMVMSSNSGTTQITTGNYLYMFSSIIITNGVTTINLGAC